MVILTRHLWESFEAPASERCVLLTKANELRSQMMQATIG